nr:helicase [Tanacetum cinerariifolium]
SVMLERSLATQKNPLLQTANQKEETWPVLLTRGKGEGLFWMTQNEQPKCGHLGSAIIGADRSSTPVESYVVRKKIGPKCQKQRAKKAQKPAALSLAEYDSLPKDDTQPRYAQLSFFDTHNEVRNRLGAFTDKETSKGADGTIVVSLIAMLDLNSSIPKEFRMERDWGDTNAIGLGKRIVMPHTFTGGPRYMMQKYQDAMSLCRAYGNQDLFITFTSKLKWSKINEMIAYVPGQRAHDRSKVGTRVFKLKLTELLDDLTKNQLSMLSNPKVRSAPRAYFAMARRALRPQTFEELLTVNRRVCVTLKEACFAYGLLNDDREWTRAIQEASLWALGLQLCDLFVTILLLAINGRNLTEFQDLPQPNRGTVKTFLYKTIISWLRLEWKIVLAIDSLGLLPCSYQLEGLLIIVAETYPNFIERQREDAYLRERAILTPRNDDVDAINTYMFDKLKGESITYNSADEIYKALTDTLDQ